MLPAAADWCEYEGTVTNSERRVQRVRKAIDPPGQARPDTHIICGIAERLGHAWGQPTAEEVWDELRSLSLNWHHGMSYARLDALGGIQWPCPTEDHPGTPLMHARLWAEDPAERGTPAPFTPVEHVPPVDELTEEFPIRLTTVRVLDAYNSGVQTGGYASPLRRRESLRMDATDGEKLGIADGERVRVLSRRGTVEAPVAFDPSLRPGLASFTPHFSEEVDINVLTNDAWDPEVGHVRVQGHGHPGGEDHRGGVRRRRLTSRLRRTSHPFAALRTPSTGCEVTTPGAKWRGAGLSADSPFGLRRDRVAGWISGCPTRSRPTPSGWRSRTCSPRTARRTTYRGRISGSPTAGTPPAVVGTSCSRRCTR